MITAQYCPLWSTSQQRHEEYICSKSTLENIPYSNCTSENMLTTKVHRRRYPTTMVYQRVYRTVCRRVYRTVCRRVYPTRVHRATYPTGRVRGEIQPTTRTYWQYTRQGYTEEYTLGYSRYSQQGCRTGNKSSKYVCTCTPELCVLKQQPSHVHLRCTNLDKVKTFNDDMLFWLLFQFCAFFLYFFYKQWKRQWKLKITILLSAHSWISTAAHKATPSPSSLHICIHKHRFSSHRFYKTKMILLIHTYTQFILTYKNIQNVLKCI